MPLIVLEGIDGCGKTTQLHLLLQRLRKLGKEPKQWREPGSTALGESVRNILLDPATDACPTAELFGYLMARAQLVYEHLAPALAQNELVVLDRFYHSTLAYQAYGLGLDPAPIEAAIDIALQGVRPDAVFYFQVTATIAAERRAAARGEDRIEARGLAYMEAVAAGYDAMAAHGDITAIDAHGDADSIHQALWAQLEPLV